MRQLFTAITLSPMSKIEVMPSKCIEIVRVSEILPHSDFGRISLKLQSYF